MKEKKIILTDLTNSINQVKLYCENEKFKGWDPYDGLNSLVFKLLKINKIPTFRWVWIQFFKRFPFNMRKFFLIKKGYNPKAIALILSAYCNLYKISSDNSQQFGKKNDLYDRIIELTNLLLSIRSSGYSGDCWGYNFDWQARHLFFFPKYTPTVVVTSFCVEALFKSYNITKDKRTLNSAVSSAKFVMFDLNRYPLKSGFLFSYSPINGNNSVYNASALGAKILSMCYKYTKNPEYKILAFEAIKSVCDGQAENGSWRYGLLEIQSWVDSFHTGYVLDSIKMYQDCTNDKSFNSYIEKGFKYYLQSFFEEDGIPKYYNDRKFPIDIHCPAQFFNTIFNLNKIKVCSSLVDKVFQWSIENMQHESGYFYYQINKLFSSKISYMRWSNAFMFNSLTNLKLAKLNE